MKQELKQVLISKEGAHRIYDEYNDLIENQRPTLLVQIQNAAAEGDRSENAEYQYGKIRLREMDKRIRFLQERIDQIKVKEAPKKNDRVAFLSWVTYLSVSAQGLSVHTIKIVGPDEIDQTEHQLSYLTPIAKALAGKYVGEYASLVLSESTQILEVLAIDLDQPKPMPTWNDLIDTYQPSQNQWIGYLSIFKVLHLKTQTTEILMISKSDLVHQDEQMSIHQDERMAIHQLDRHAHIKKIAYDQIEGQCFLGKKAGDLIESPIDQSYLEILEIIDSF